MVAFLKPSFLPNPSPPHIYQLSGPPGGPPELPTPPGHVFPDPPFQFRLSLVCLPFLFSSSLGFYFSRLLSEFFFPRFSVEVKFDVKFEYEQIFYSSGRSFSSLYPTLSPFSGPGVKDNDPSSTEHKVVGVSFLLGFSLSLQDFTFNPH